MDYKSNLLGALPMLALGIVMLFFSDIALATVVLVVGILFIAVGVVSVAVAFNRNNVKSKTINLLSGIGACVLGILMTCTPDTMLNLIIYLFAASFILLGLYRIIKLAFLYRPITFPGWFYVLPSLLVVTGIVICVIGPSTVARTITMITGIAFIVYAVAALSDMVGFMVFRRAMNRTAAANHQIEDVVAEEVDSSKN